MKFPVTQDVRFVCRGQENDSSPDSPMHTYRCIGRYEKVFRPIKWVYSWRASPVSKARKCIGATGFLRSTFWIGRTGSVPAKSRQQHIFPDPLAAVVNGITPINSTATGPIHSLTLTLKLFICKSLLCYALSGFNSGIRKLIYMISNIWVHSLYIV